MTIPGGANTYPGAIISKILLRGSLEDSTHQILLTLSIINTKGAIGGCSPEYRIIRQKIFLSFPMGEMWGGWWRIYSVNWCAVGEQNVN